MGQRANIAIGNAERYDLFYSHWCANTLPHDLFGGSDHAVDFVSCQRKVDRRDGWLDTIWAEGGAVIDPHAMFQSTDLSHRTNGTTLIAPIDGHFQQGVA